MTTIKLFNGDLGSDRLLVRCDLTRAESPVEVNYGDGWQPTQYQCADTRHRDSGLASLGMKLAAEGGDIPSDEFTSEWERIDEAS